MNTLALSTKVQNGVKPPAKKHEVIAAMAQVKFEQMRAAKAKLLADFELAQKLAGDALTAHVRQNADSMKIEPHLGYTSSNGYVHNVGVGVTVIFENLPKSLQKLIKESHKAETEFRNVRVPELKTIKQQIAAAMDGTTPVNLRVQALVETPETRKAIEKMLAALDQPKTATINV